MKFAITGAILLGSVSCRPASAPASPPEITVTGVDYTFQLPDSIHPGLTLVRFHNAGTVPHEMAFALLKAGVTMAQVLEVEQAGGNTDSLVDGVIGILIAQPGTTSIGSLATDFLPGRTYGLMCSFQDAEDKPPHVMLGMLSSFAVTKPQ